MKKYILWGILPLFILAFISLKGKIFSEKRPDLTIVCNFKTSDKLNIQALQIAKSLHHNMKIGFVPLDVYHHEIPKDIQAISKKAHKLAPVVLFSESLWYPNVPHYTKIFPMERDSHIFIAYSVFHGTKIPKTWTTILNDYFDALVVPDSNSTKIYRDSSVSIPIFELPLLNDFSQYLSAPIKSEKGTPFVFGNFENCTDRNNQIQLVRAFAKTYGNREDVQLKIFYAKGDRASIQCIQNEIEQNNLKNILFMKTDNTPEIRFNSLQQMDCYVSFSKNDFYPLSCLQSMALGTPAIVARNSSFISLAETGLVQSIAALIPEKVYFESIEPTGEFFNCSVEDAAISLQDSFENYDEHLKMAQNRRELIRQYNLDTLLPQYSSLFNPSKLVLGPTNEATSEYLMTSSQKLYDKYQKVLSLK